MFPTIYGIALHGLGDDTKFGAAGLVMAILGGATVPLIHGAVMDSHGAALSYVVPGLASWSSRPSGCSTCARPAMRMLQRSIDQPGGCLLG